MNNDKQGKTSHIYKVLQEFNTRKHIGSNSYVKPWETVKTPNLCEQSVKYDCLKKHLLLGKDLV